MACNQHDTRVHRGPRIAGGIVALVALAALALMTPIAQAEQDGRPKKPILPMIQIDNEGPEIVMRPARLAREHHGRQAAPTGQVWFPGRSVLRLDLILPIRPVPMWMIPERLRPIPHRVDRP